MPSAEYTALNDRIAALALRFVDFDIPLEREPAQEELDRIAAFKLLAHAEFETFIETRIRQTIESALSLWRTGARITPPIFGLILRWYPHFERDRNKYFLPQASSEVTALLELLSKGAIQEIQDNNGIKKDAFSRLSYSAGILVDDHAAELLAALESYGKNRGEVAHNAVGKVRTLNGPRVEAANAKQIVELLRPFDARLRTSVS